MTTSTAERRLISTEQYNSARTSGLEAGRVMPVGDRSGAYRVGFADFEMLTLLIDSAGYGSTNDNLAQVRALSAAADAASESALSSLSAACFAVVDPATTTPAQVGPLVRHVAVSFMLRHATSNDYLASAVLAYRESLIPFAKSAALAYAASAVETMRPDFDAAVGAVTAAHAVGITSATTGGQIAEDGTPKQVAAWRSLPAAVAKLSKIGDLRIRIHNLIETQDYRAPSIEAIARLVLIKADDPETRDLMTEGAANAFTGDSETVAVRSDHPAAAPFPKSIPARRVGGPWLALVAAGYPLRLAPVEVKA